MLWGLLNALLLMALCVAIHAGGVTAALRLIQKGPATTPRFWSWTWLFVRLAGWMVLLHLVEIAVWGAFFVWRRAIPDPASALYFSAVTYTTTGYGDIVLPEAWRLYSAVEALTGILMCGWSTGFFFAVVNRIYQSRPEGQR
jgi:NADH:ubiquinone oxidoreductase subunit 6 (subunit J)